MEKIINLDIPKNQTVLRFFSKNNEIDFLDCDLKVATYFNDSQFPLNDFNVGLYVKEQNQKKNHVFELPIFENDCKVKIILESSSLNLDLIQTAIR